MLIYSFIFLFKFLIEIVSLPSYSVYEFYSFVSEILQVIFLDGNVFQRNIQLNVPHFSNDNFEVPIVFQIISKFPALICKVKEAIKSGNTISDFWETLYM